MDISFLNSLTQDQIIQGSFPLEEILKDSLFYPACGHDGGVIKYCNTFGRDLNINSYVYCDYHVKEEIVCNKINTEILGYHVFAHKILAEELLLTLPKTTSFFPFTVNDLVRYNDNIKGVTPYCHWFVLLRDDDYDDSHGPLRFSLLYICAEGVAAYAGLYNANVVAPKAVAIIQPGHGFGGNWTDFTNEDNHLARIMKQNPVKMPDYIFYGGLWSVRSSWDYMDLNWSFYKNIAVINDYYNSGNGRVVIYKNRRDDRINFCDLMNKDYCVSIVKETVFNKKLKECIELIVGDLRRARQNCISINGRHGCGKSHFLVFLSLIAEDKHFVDYVNDEMVKSMLLNIAGQYVVKLVESKSLMKLHDFIETARNEAKGKKLLILVDGLDQYLQSKGDVVIHDLLSIQEVMHSDDIHLVFSLNRDSLDYSGLDEKIDLFFCKILGKCRNYWLDL